MKEFDKLIDIVKKLRAPDGCPWDRKQTLYSLKDALLEETCELIDALDNKDIENIKEELGDQFINVDEQEAITYFRKIGTEHELQKIKDILKEYRVLHDVWFSETSLYNENKVEPTIQKLKDRGYTYEADGALWFKSTEFGDDKDRVLIKTDGSYTYLTPDIAYHLNKLDRGYEYLVDLLGADHHGYIARMKAAIQALGYNSDQLNIDIMQMVRMVENGEVVKRLN